MTIDVSHTHGSGTGDYFSDMSDDDLDPTDTWGVSGGGGLLPLPLPLPPNPNQEKEPLLAAPNTETVSVPAQHRTFSKPQLEDKRMVDAVNQISLRASDPTKLTISHPHSNQRFSYNVADLCDQEYVPPPQPETQTVYLAMYATNTKSPMNPFLHFALARSDTTSTTPPPKANKLETEATLQPPPEPETEQTGIADEVKSEGAKVSGVGFPSMSFVHTITPSDDAHTQFTSACYQKIFELLAIEPTPELSVDQLASLVQFRGVYNLAPPSLPGSDLGPAVYAFFELSPERADALVRDAKLVWGTVHEIANANRIRADPVLPSTLAVFDAEPELLYIKNDHGVPVNIPFVLYATQVNADGTYTLAPSRTTGPDSRLQHTLVRNYDTPYGYYALFSDHPSVAPEIPLARYVVFVDHTLYLIGPDAEKKQTFDTAVQSTAFSGVYFQDATGEPRWGVRTVDAYMWLD